jgi:quercetin 2,3-dioxygenase
MHPTRATPSDGPVFELLSFREPDLGGGERVRRVLPGAARRTIGPWCFVDLFGPLEVGHPLVVRAHPHIGLSTVTWLHGGAIDHRDSLGIRQTIRAGQLNLMTAGRGIAHSERRHENGEPLSGVQLWLALPDDQRAIEPAFVHLSEVPKVKLGDAVATVLLGELAGVASPAPRHHPVLGVELALAATTEIPLDPAFEHGIVSLAGTLSCEDQEVPDRVLVHLGRGRTSLRLSGESKVLLLGGAPFGEVLLWWNFVARTEAELQVARADWEEGRFGEVVDERERIPAPPLPGARA